MSAPVAASSGRTARSPRRVRRRRGARLTAVLLVAEILAALGGLCAMWKPLRDQILLSTTRRPVPMTELFFPAPGRLPSSLDAGASYSVTFSVTNDSDQARTYRPIATAQWAVGREILLRTTLDIAAGRTDSATVSFTPPGQAAGHVYLVTVLVSPTDTIRFGAPVR